jgi:hypothetical protein
MHPALFPCFSWLRPTLQCGTSLGLLLGLALPLAAQRARPGARAGRSAGPVALNTLAARPTLYGVGVAEGGGEILVVAGQAWTTRHRPDGATETTTGFQGRAGWLLQSRVAQWQDAGLVPANADNPARLARFIQQVATRAGRDGKQALPFRLVGEPLVMWWHVAAFPTARPTDDTAGPGAHGSFARARIDLVGFLHPTTRRTGLARLHLHGRPDSQPFAMHVDSLRPGRAVHLLLPALP